MDNFHIQVSRKPHLKTFKILLDYRHSLKTQLPLRTPFKDSTFRTDLGHSTKTKLDKHELFPSTSKNSGRRNESKNKLTQKFERFNF